MIPGEIDEVLDIISKSGDVFKVTNHKKNPLTVTCQLKQTWLHSYDLISVTDFCTQRFRLVGTVTAPYSFERITFVERDHGKFCKTLNLASFENSTIAYDFGRDQDRFVLIARGLNQIELHGTTGPSRSYYEGWVHIIINNGK